MERMKQAKYGVILFGMGLTMTRGKHLNSHALLSLARDMNAHTRFVCKPMRGHGNVTGADNVLTWRTGYPFAVNLREDILASTRANTRQSTRLPEVRPMRR